MIQPFLQGHRKGLAIMANPFFILLSRAGIGRRDNKQTINEGVKNFTNINLLII